MSKDVKHEFQIISFSRTTTSGNVETIPFVKGINLLQGSPNTGKTIWLQSFNFLLGADNSANYYFPPKFLSKYYSLECKLLINSDIYIIKRNWHTKGQKTKVLCNSKSLDCDSFQEFILEKLGIPKLKYPKPDPLSDIKATNLSFRMHFRHLYRQQKYWNDLVAKQPESEFRSVLLNFLGLAELMYTPNYYKFYNSNDEIKLADEKINRLLYGLDSLLKVYISNYNQSFDAKKIVITSQKFVKRLESSLNTTNNDVQVGRIMERKDVIGKLLHKIEQYEDEKLAIAKNSNKYFDEIKTSGKKIDINSRLELISNSMNLYLQNLNLINKGVWNHGLVSIDYDRKFLTFKVGRGRWDTVLGGTDSLYFCLAYQYALLVTSLEITSNIPSCLIIDLPPDIKGENNLEDDDFIMKPFKELLDKNEYSHCQVIFAGNIFNTKIPDHIFRLENVYKS